MIRGIIGFLGWRIDYVSSWGVHERRYSGLDFATIRPIHDGMSVAPPWARMRLTRTRGVWRDPDLPHSS